MGLTFCLSIPVCTVIGCFLGALLGSCQGSSAGFVVGGAAGYLVSQRPFVGELTHLVEHSKYGKSNRLKQVTCASDLATGFDATPGRPKLVGQHFGRYLEEAVHLYRLLNDNKSGIQFLDGVEAARVLDTVEQNLAVDELSRPQPLREFSHIVGNYARSSDNSGWMLASREPALSPIGQRELWLVVRGSTTLLDWFRDAEALNTPVDIGLDAVGVCTGFYKKAASIIKDMEDRNALDAIRVEARRLPFQKIFIVGHSLAGAVVTQIQSFTAVPLSSAVACWSSNVMATFGPLQAIWAAALGERAFNQVTVENVSEYFLTFALEPAPAFKSKGGPKCWESDAYEFQTKTSLVKQVLEQTLVLTLYGGDPVPRLNIEVGGLALPPIKLGLFYSSPDPVIMSKKYQVMTNSLYFMEGPLTDNRITRFLVWSDIAAVDTFASRVQQVRNVLEALSDRRAALQLAAGNVGADHVQMFRPDTFVAGLRNLSATPRTPQVETSGGDEAYVVC